MTGARGVAIISTVLAKNHFPDGSPIGRQVLIDDTDGAPRPVQIVGVVGSVKQSNFQTPARPDIYLPLRQIPKEGVPFIAQQHLLGGQNIAWHLRHRTDVKRCNSEC